METKTFDVAVKAFAGEAAAGRLPEGWDLQEGDFAAYASTFGGSPDSVGDIVRKGAFADTLDAWRSKDAPMPLLYGHRMDDPDYNIGHIVDAKEDEKGLLVWGRIDLEGPKGRQVARLVKTRRINQLSFAYDVQAGTKNDHGGRDLSRLKLHEVSLVQLGANRNTSVLAAKAAIDQLGQHEGEFTDEQHETLTEALGRLDEARETLARLVKNAPHTETPAEPEAEKAAGEAAGEAKAAASPDTPATPASEPEAARRARLTAAMLTLATII